MSQPPPRRRESPAEMMARFSDISDGRLKTVAIQAKLIEHAHIELQQSIAFATDEQAVVTNMDYWIDAIQGKTCQLNAMINTMFDELVQARKTP